MTSLHKHSLKTALTLFVYVFICKILYLGTAVAGTQITITEEEINTLPKFCIAKFAKGEAGQLAQRQWFGAIGPDYLYMHHHCYGLLHKMRAYKPGLSKSQRDFERATAIDEFNFVLKNSGPDFFLRPEVLAHKGEMQGMLGDTLHAEESFESASKLKSDFPLIYSQWAEMWISKGNRKRAKEVIERAYANSADSKHLRQLAKILGVTSKPAPPKPDLDQLTPQNAEHNEVIPNNASDKKAVLDDTTSVKATSTIVAPTSEHAPAEIPAAVQQ